MGRKREGKQIKHLQSKLIENTIYIAEIVISSKLF